MDGPGRYYLDTPGPGRHFPAWSEGVIVQKRKKFYVFFFAFQAILNTFYFWVKNLEKKYSKSQEDTPPPHNWKNILYLYFMFHAILSTFKFFWKNKYLIGTDGPVKFLPARSDFVVFKCTVLYFISLKDKKQKSAKIGAKSCNFLNDLHSLEYIQEWNRA